MSNDVTRIERVDPTPTSDMFVATLKGLFGGLFPPIGQSIEAFVNWRSRVKQEKINSFLDQTIKQVERDKVDYEFLKTDEFGNLFEEILIKISTNRNEAKRERYTQLSVAAIQGCRPPDFSKVFLDILSEITDQEIILFRNFYDFYEQRKAMPNPENAIPKYKFTKEHVEKMNLRYEDYLLMVQSMIRKGILFDDGMGRYDCNPYEVPFPTELGIRFYEYVTCK